MVGLGVAGINAMSRYFYIGTPHGPASEAQLKVLTLLQSDCRHFVSDAAAQSPKDIMKFLGGKAHSYWGEPVYTAMDLTVRQVILALPAVGVAASCDICEVLDGQLRDQLRDPASLLRPSDEWPWPMPKAKTMLADPTAWLALANLMWTRGLCLWLPSENIFAPYGDPMVSGLFRGPQCQRRAWARRSVSTATDMQFGTI